MEGVLSYCALLADTVLPPPLHGMDDRSVAELQDVDAHVNNTYRICTTKNSLHDSGSRIQGLPMPAQTSQEGYPANP